MTFESSRVRYIIKITQSSGLFILDKKGLIQLRNHWYISLAGNYPQRAMSAQIAKRYTIIELTDEATPQEIDQYKLVLVGIGWFNDEHIQQNIARWIR